MPLLQLQYEQPPKTKANPAARIVPASQSSRDSAQSETSERAGAKRFICRPASSLLGWLACSSLATSLLAWPLEGRADNR